MILDVVLADAPAVHGVAALGQRVEDVVLHRVLGAANGGAADETLQEFGLRVEAAVDLIENALLVFAHGAHASYPFLLWRAIIWQRGGSGRGDLPERGQRCVAELAKRAAKGTEDERDAVLAGRDGDGAEQDIGAQDRRGRPSMSATHHGCQMSLSTTKPPSGLSASRTMRVLA